MNELLNRLLQPEIVVLLIPIAAIPVGGAVAITKMVIRHRERMAMIEHGIDPSREGDDDLDDANLGGAARAPRKAGGRDS